MASVAQHGRTDRICDIVLLFQDQACIADTASVALHGRIDRIYDIVLLFQDQTSIADTWRVLHSMAGQIEYVI